MSLVNDRLEMAKSKLDLLSSISLADLSKGGEARKRNIVKLRSILTEIDNMLVELGEQRATALNNLNRLERAEGESLTVTDAAPRLEVEIRQPRQRYSQPVEPTGPLKLFEGSLPEVIYRILSEAGRPITWDELREGLRKNPTTTKVENDKSYYSGVQRLKEKGYCVAYKGRISTPENLKKFLEDVEAGRAVDVEVMRYRNKWADAILEFIQSRPNKTATYAEIKGHLQSHPEFSSKLSGDKPMLTYFASTLTQMVTKKGLLEKPMRGYYRLKGASLNDDKLRAPEAPASEARH